MQYKAKQKLKFKISQIATRIFLLPFSDPRISIFRRQFSIATDRSLVLERDFSPLEETFVKASRRYARLVPAFLLHSPLSRLSRATSSVVKMLCLCAIVRHPWRISHGAACTRVRVRLCALKFTFTSHMPHLVETSLGTANSYGVGSPPTYQLLHNPRLKLAGILT